MKQGLSVTLEELLYCRFQAKRLSLAAYARSSSGRHGTRHSRQLGRGMEFTEVRHYEPGDDIRSLDWKVTARTNKPHTKLFHEEKERPVYVVVDQGHTMLFGTRSCLKSVQAARVASLLAWAASSEGDRVGGLISAHDTCIETPARNQQHGVLSLIQKLVEQQENKVPGHFDLAQSMTLVDALHRLIHLSLQGGLLILISDFFCYDEDFRLHLTMLKQRNQLLLVNITDPLEHELPRGGVFSFSDGQKTLNIDSSNMSQRVAYSQLFQEHENQLRRQLQQLGIPYCNLLTTDDAFLQLQSQLNGKVSP